MKEKMIQMALVVVTGLAWIAGVFTAVLYTEKMYQTVSVNTLTLIGAIIAVGVFAVLYMTFILLAGRIRCKNG